MNVTCAECGSVFRVDPAKIPQAGIRARCSVCGGVIAIGEHGAIDDDFVAPVVRGAPAAARGRIQMSSATAQVSSPAAPVSPAPPSMAPRPAMTLPTPPMLSRTAPPEPVAKAVPPVAAHRTAPSAAPRTAPAPQRAPAEGAASAARPTSPVPTPKPQPRPPAPMAAPATPSATSVATSRSTPAAPAAAPATRPPINPFLANDPNQKAKRLARALISDIIAYFPDKHREGLQNGTLRELFREEIKKSYEEYVEQMGKDFATSTTHFQDALNEVLAKGKKVF